MTNRPRPALAVIREGNPGHRKARESLRLPPAELTEPAWAEVFPSEGRPVGEVRRLREVASQEWRTVVPVLSRSAGVAAVDGHTLRDYCVAVARIDQGERALTLDGVLMQGERGMQKNGWTTVLGQYRTQLRAYVVELGLSPSARTRLTQLEEDDEDDPFD